MLKKLFLSSILVLSLSGCALIQGPVEKSTIIPLRSGNPATVIDKDKVSTIKTDDGKVQIVDDKSHKVIVQGVIGDMNLQGFDVIDDATLLYYQNLHKLYGADYQKRLANGEFNK